MPHRGPRCKRETSGPQPLTILAWRDVHLAAYGHFVIAGSDYASHDELIVAMRISSRSSITRRRGERIREVQKQQERLRDDPTSQTV